MDQVPQPISGQGTVASSLPETTTSLLTVCVCVFAALAPLMCAHVFCYNAQNADDPTNYVPNVLRNFVTPDVYSYSIAFFVA